MYNALLDRIVAELTQRSSYARWRRGEFHADCPYCGKAAKPGQKHFAVWERGFKCWVCDMGGSLGKLAEELFGEEIKPARSSTAPSTPVRPQAPWHVQPEPYVERYCSALDRVSAWQAYKPLTLESISRWKLGVGKLPFFDEQRQRWYDGKYRRLIVPTFSHGDLVALDGRAIHPEDTAAKWICATGSRKDVLFNGDLLTPGCTVVIVENKVDAILAMQETPNVVVVTSGGLTWREEFSAQIASVRPRRVLIWLDHDIRGNCTPKHCPQCQREYADWLIQMQQRLATGKIRELPRYRGPAAPRIANSLKDTGIWSVHIYDWPRYVPTKADMGWMLMHSMRRAA